MIDDPFSEFKQKSNYRLNKDARVCANCVHYWEYYEERTCNLASRETPDGKRILEMWTDPNFVCDRFTNNNIEGELDK